MAQRNDPCPCGSGKKYKVCCLKKDEANAQLSKLNHDIENIISEKTGPYLFWRRWSAACQRSEYGLVYQFLLDGGMLKEDFATADAFFINLQNIGLPYAPEWTLRNIKVSETKLYFLATRNDALHTGEQTASCMVAQRTQQGWRVSEIIKRTFIPEQHKHLNFGLFGIESLMQSYQEKLATGWTRPDLADRTPVSADTPA